MSKSREQLEDWLSKIELNNKQVLDIGCQDKPICGRIKHENCSFTTMDNDSQWLPDIIAEIETWNYEGGELKVAKDEEGLQNAESIQINNYTNTFSVIFAIETFEHVKSIEDALFNIHACMTNRGKLYFAMPFINPLHDYYDHARYTPEGFEYLLNEAGFELEDLQYRRATVGREDLLNFYKKEGMRISKIRAKDRHLIDMIGFMGVAIKK